MNHDASDRPLPINTEEARASEELSDEAGVHPRDERQDRIEALASLAAEAGYASPASVTAASQSPSTVHLRWRRWVTASLALVVVIAGGGVGLLSLMHRGQSNGVPPAIPATLTLDLSQTPLLCPNGFVWSPDGTQLALWGTSGGGGCQTSATHPLAIIFDTRTGKALRTIDLANPLAAHGISANGFGITDFTWSPDGKALVVAVNLPSAQSGSFAHGLLLIPLDGSTSTFYGPKQPTSQFATLIWNVRSGTLMSETTELPPALSYQWTADGHVIPAQMFPATSSSAELATPTGRSAPANGFTFWQDGIIDSLAPDSLSAPPAAALFQASVLRWSPDGENVLLHTGLGGALQFVTPASPKLCFELGLPTPCQLPVLPPPDAAVSVVLRALARPWAPGAGPNGTVVQQYYDGSTPLAWSANGKLLATILPQDEFNLPTSDKATVTVLDASTGGSRAQFPYVCPDSNGGCRLDVSWSPSDKQLAAFDFQSG
ncbi:MAG TPA: hypothetical protein VKT52_05720, partial [Ktedonobacterales bacterium]|nr:hypothetical protein [Ktedonobacterales bacterium]